MPLCLCPRCQRVPTADRRWGFDRARVPFTHCLMCDQPIGHAPYEPVTILARFGQMSFKHVLCPTNRMKSYSVPYWIKHKLAHVSTPETIICSAIKRHFETPEQSDIHFIGTPLEMINALYLEWKKRGTVHHCLFPTPLAVAQQLARFAGVTRKDIVFDPGCGFGNLLQAAVDIGARAFGVEAQSYIPQFIAPLVGLDIQRGDYLDGYRPGKFTCILTNPPFGKGWQGDRDIPDLTEGFLGRIADQCSPGTRIAAILPNRYVDKERPKQLVETFARFSIVKRQPLPDGTFKPLTGVSTEMVLLKLGRGSRPPSSRRTIQPSVPPLVENLESPDVLIRKMIKDVDQARKHLTALSRELTHDDVPPRYNELPLFKNLK